MSYCIACTVIKLHRRCTPRNNRNVTPILRAEAPNTKRSIHAIFTGDRTTAIYKEIQVHCVSKKGKGDVLAVERCTCPNCETTIVILVTVSCSVPKPYHKETDVIVTEIVRKLLKLYYYYCSIKRH